MNDAKSAESMKNAIYDALVQALDASGLLRLRDMATIEHWERKRSAARNPLLRSGRKYFSQNDEDGILLEICRRTGIDSGVFVELGVGNGLENNSLVLLMNGWQGLWCGGETLAFQVPDNGPLVFKEAWITREGCATLVSQGLKALGKEQAHLLSIDLDGNDLYVVQTLLESGLAPDIVILEYNAKFPPPIRWSQAYDPNHRWDGSDYFGASLQSLVDALHPHGYRLVACNITGVNAFFVSARHAPRFADVPTDVGDLFMEADYNWYVYVGHTPSPRTIARVLASRK